MIGPGLPHDRPPLSKRALATGRLPVLATADVLAQKGIAHLDGLVTELDLAARRLTVTPANGGVPIARRGAAAGVGDGASVSAAARAGAGRVRRERDRRRARGTGASACAGRGGG